MHYRCGNGRFGNRGSNQNLLGFQISKEKYQII